MASTMAIEAFPRTPNFRYQTITKEDGNELNKLGAILYQKYKRAWPLGEFLEDNRKLACAFATDKKGYPFADFIVYKKSMHKPIVGLVLVEKCGKKDARLTIILKEHQEYDRQNAFIEVFENVMSKIENTFEHIYLSRPSIQIDNLEIKERVFVE